MSPNVGVAPSVVLILLSIPKPSHSVPLGEEATRERRLKLGYASETRSGGAVLVGFSTGFHWAHTEVSVLRETVTSSGVASEDGRPAAKEKTRYLIELAALAPVIQREHGHVRPALYVGASVRMGLRKSVPEFVEYDLGFLIGAGVSAGRWSLESRVRLGMARWTYLPVSVPRSDLASGSLIVLVGARF